MSKKYFWVCEYSKNTGEGNLARLYLDKIKNKKKIVSGKVFFKNKILNKIINYKYVSPFFGILICWYLFLKKKDVSYVNYLPLWNFLIFPLKVL